jgi:hypothetical protein
VLRLREAIHGHDAPLAIRTDPELRVHFVFRDDLAGQDVAHEQIIVHRLRDDLGDRRRHKLDESVVFRPASLYANLFIYFSAPNKVGRSTGADAPSCSAKGGDAISLRIGRNMRGSVPRRSRVEFGRDILRPFLTPARGTAIE